MATTPKPDLGAKFTCFKCQCKFYDLGRPEPLCPRCGADQREDPAPDPREAYSSPRRRGKKKPKKASVAATPSVEDTGDGLLDDEDDAPPAKAKAKAKGKGKAKAKAKK